MSIPLAADGNRRTPGTDRRSVRTLLSAARPWVATAACLLLGGVFVVTGALKMPDPAAAVRTVRAYQLLPEALLEPVAFGLPVLEIAVGLALFVGVFVRTAALASAVLLVIFIAGIAGDRRS